jgi:hypothetical protein
LIRRTLCHCACPKKLEGQVKQVDSAGKLGGPAQDRLSGENPPTPATANDAQMSISVVIPTTAANEARLVPPAASCPMSTKLKPGISRTAQWRSAMVMSNEEHVRCGLTINLLCATLRLKNTFSGCGIFG